MRIGLSKRQAISISWANCSSRFAPLPTLPGLIRNLASASAQAGCSVSSLWPLKWKSPIKGTSTFNCSRRSRIFGTAAAASRVFTVMRTSSDPARASSATCFAVLKMSSVSVLVMDWTTIGAVPPTPTFPTSARRLARRAVTPARASELAPGNKSLMNCPPSPAPHHLVRAYSAYSIESRATFSRV